MYTAKITIAIDRIKLKYAPTPTYALDKDESNSLISALILINAINDANTDNMDSMNIMGVTYLLY